MEEEAIKWSPASQILNIAKKFAACPEEVGMNEEHWRIRRAMNPDIGDGDFVHIDRPQMAYDEAAVMEKAGFSEVLYCTVGVEGTLLLIAKK